MSYRLSGILVLIAVLSACGSPSPSPSPIPATATPMPEIPTPTPTMTVAPPAPTLTPTPAPTPTAFITPPPAGQAANIPILMYHHLADLADNASEVQRTWTVAPKNFEAQIAWLAEHGFHAITLPQLGAFLKRGQPLPGKPIVISFDDGWEDDYTVAFPILKKHGFVGTFFVYTNAIDHKQFLNWKEVEEMSAAGMDFQSHTLSHARLRTLTVEAAMKELVDSKSTLEKRLGKPVTTLAYPDGEYNTAVIDLLKRAGYESAVTIAAGYKQRADEMFTLHRTRVTYTETLQSVLSRLP